MSKQSPVPPEMVAEHEQLLRLHCEGPTTAQQIAERSGKRLHEVVEWYKRPDTLEDLAVLQLSTDVSMRIFLAQHRLSAIAKLIEIVQEGEGETARRAAKDLLTFSGMRPPAAAMGGMPALARKSEAKKTKPAPGAEPPTCTEFYDFPAKNFPAARWDEMNEIYVKWEEYEEEEKRQGVFGTPASRFALDKSVHARANGPRGIRRWRC